MKRINEWPELKLLWRGTYRYVIPLIMGMVLSQSAPAVDAICVAAVMGEEALSALITVMPMGYLISMIGTLGGLGSGVYISKCSGSGDRERAGRVFTRSVIIMAAISCLISLVVWVFHEPFLTLLHTTEDNHDFTRDYLLVMLLGSPVMTLAFASEYYLINDNNPNLGMISTMAGAVVNILTDYLGMYVFRGGIWVAALGTVLGSLFTCLVSLLHLRKKDRLCRFVSPRRREGDLNVWEILKPGSAEGVMYLLLGVQLLVQNHVLRSSAGISGLGNSAIIENLQLFFTIIVAGTTDALYPVVSAYEGEQNRSCMLLAKRTLARISYVLLLPAVASLCIFPEIVFFLFSVDDPVMLATLPWSIRVVSVTATLNIASTLMIDYLSSTEKEMKATVAMAIQILASCLLAILLEESCSVDAPWYADLLSNVIVLVYLILCGEKVFRGMILFWPENLRMLTGGKLNSRNLKEWEAASGDILNREERQLVSEKMTGPLLASMPEKQTDSSWTILERDDGNMAVILRYDGPRDKKGKDGPEEEEEKELELNTCIRSEFFGMHRLMMVLDRGKASAGAEAPGAGG